MHSPRHVPHNLGCRLWVGSPALGSRGDLVRSRRTGKLEVAPGTQLGDPLAPLALLPQEKWPAAGRREQREGGRHVPPRPGSLLLCVPRGRRGGRSRDGDAWPGRPARARCGPGQGHACALGWTEALPPRPGPILLHHTGPGQRAWEMPCSSVTRGRRPACSHPAGDGARVWTLAGATWPDPLPGPAGRQLPKREGGSFGVALGWSIRPLFWPGASQERKALGAQGPESWPCLPTVSSMETPYTSLGFQG